jgi:hypothetical protein
MRVGGSDEAIHLCGTGLLRGACHRARIRATHLGFEEDDYRTGAEICSVRSRSLMSTTVTIGAISS